MKVNKKDLNKCGIYCIRNLVNNKVYIGKSKNIYTRIMSHQYNLRIKSKDENRHLIYAWHKYGEDNFDYFVIEYLPLDDKLVAERELYWMCQFNSTNRNCGYNLRQDSSTTMIVHEETKQLISSKTQGEKNPNYNNRWSEEQKKIASEKFKSYYKEGKLKPNLNATYKAIKIRNQRWKENPQLKQDMVNKVKEAITKYKIYQYDKNTNELIRIWDYVSDIIKENPNYKKHNIYAVCSGEKPSIYGYKWVKVLIDDIVQTDTKLSE